MSMTQIEVDTITASEAGEVAIIDGEWSAEKILQFTMKKGRSRQCYVAKIDGQIIGFMIAGPAGAWLMIHRLRTLTSDEATESLVGRAKRVVRRINTIRAARAYLTCTGPELLAGIMFEIAPGDVNGNVLLRKNGFLATEILKDEKGKTVAVVMTWDRLPPAQKGDGES